MGVSRKNVVHRGRDVGEAARALREAGVNDFARYAVAPGQPLQFDLFL